MGGEFKAREGFRKLWSKARAHKKEMSAGLHLLVVSGSLASVGNAKKFG
jgi:hypothetical protein